MDQRTSASVSSAFHEGRNCWRQQKADHVSIIVDYGNYYRDLRESIIKACKSIFVLGWDIDSRIEMVRGDDIYSDHHPVTFFDLIYWKASQNPDLHVYLNRWDYSSVFLRQRELFWIRKWKSTKLPNIHVCMDSFLPLSACHHQKIVVVDDEVAYWGGMDVALNRWDFRQHHVINDHRKDPALFPTLGRKDKFDPYHDVQAVLSGAAARSLAEWARIRWSMACPKITPVKIEPLKALEGTPHCWPDSDPPDFENIDVALARTMPEMKHTRQIEEISALLHSEIRQAENFIYIENQFLASEEIATALNEQLRRNRNLRVLIVSCYDPGGIMERLAMWGGRVRFKDILISGGVGDRVAMAYPICKEDNKTAIVRIHSKIMIIDDRYMHIGSANINNRSMGLDTEFDVSLFGNDERSCAKIASVRNDLIREHTGYEARDIEEIVQQGDVKTLLDDCKGSRQHLQEINDEPYRSPVLSKLISKIADPRRPIIAGKWTRLPRLNPQQSMTLVMVILVAACLAALWTWTPLSQFTEKEHLETLLQEVRTSPISFLWVMGLYILCGLFFFPITAMSTAIILIFGGWQGLAYSMIGALISGTMGYWIGKAIGKERLLKIFPKAKPPMEKVSNSGVIGVAVIRMLPIAPFTLVNIIMGVIHVPLLSFILGTALGLSPGKIMLAIFGESFIEVFKHPDLQNVMYAGVGLALWVAVILVCNKLAKQWQAKHQRAA